MGCDIHMWLEHEHKYHNATSNWWPFGSEIGGDRDYELFARMAGVRGDGPEPKGWPENIGWCAEAHAPGVDADLHSHTWFTLEEFEPLIRDCGVSYMALAAAARAFVLAGHDVRILVAFDN